MEKKSIIEELTTKLDNVVNKAKKSNELRTSIIKLQENLISELIEQLNSEKQRGLISFKAGVFAGLVLGTVICIIFSLLINLIK